MSLSLQKILNDPSLLLDNERLRKKIEEVKKDKTTLNNAASDYNSRYREEIEEGTKKKQLLLSDGAKKGLKEEDVMKGSFIPTKYTPILNWLYFLLREDNNSEFEESRRKYNEQYGSLQENYEYHQSGNVEEPKEMDTFIYGNMSHKQFQTIKKLKTLALSSKCNEAESALAFSVCKELCQRYGLEFDKIPVNN